MRERAKKRSILSQINGIISYYGAISNPYCISGHKNRGRENGPGFVYFAGKISRTVSVPPSTEKRTSMPAKAMPYTRFGSPW